MALAGRGIFLPHLVAQACPAATAPRREALRSGLYHRPCGVLPPLSGVGRVVSEGRPNASLPIACTRWFLAVFSGAAHARHQGGLQVFRHTARFYHQPYGWGTLWFRPSPDSESPLCLPFHHSGTLSPRPLGHAASRSFPPTAILRSLPAQRNSGLL